MYRILTKEMLTPTICRMKVEAPRLASAAQPGQFLIIRADEHGERIPLTISDFEIFSSNPHTNKPNLKLLSRFKAHRFYMLEPKSDDLSLSASSSV